MDLIKNAVMPFIVKRSNQLDSAPPHSTRQMYKYHNQNSCSSVVFIYFIIILPVNVFQKVNAHHKVLTRIEYLCCESKM